MTRPHPGGRIAGAAILIILGAGCAHRVPSAADSGTDSLLERQAVFLSSLEARDADRAAEYFSDDAVLHVAGMPPLTGRPAIHRFYENVFGSLSASEHGPTSMTVSDSGDMAFSTGPVVNVFATDEGAVEFTGKHLTVWELRRGVWWVVAYSISSDRG